MRYKSSLFFPHSSTIMSMKAGPLYPALVREMYPNEKIIISHEALLRAAPMLFPLYSPMKLRFDYFFSPHRIVWKGDETKDFSTFITGSIDGTAITDPNDLPVHPYIVVPNGGFAPGSLGDYLGYCSHSTLAGAEVSALRFRHYQRIVKDYYTDENFGVKPNIGYAEGLDTTTDLDLKYRCWNKDRFTTALNSPTKGLNVGISLTGDIPVVGNGKTLGVTDGFTIAGTQFNTSNVWISNTQSVGVDLGQNVYPSPVNSLGNNRNIGVTTDPTKSGLIADASEVDAIPIDDLHFLTQVQRLNQRLNMWGSRDFECIFNQFGCTIPDTRLQRATHLGWSEVDVNFSEVVQTSQTTTGSTGSAQGNIAGHTLAVSANKPVRFFCREWGFLFVIVNIQPIAQYQDGIPRDALYKTRYDYMWPVLSETGFQEIFQAEVYGTSTNVNQRGIFGFEPRYNHLRFGEKTVHGDFRTSLAGYHAGRIFTNEPNLGTNFITADPTNRMFAVTGQEYDPWWLRIEFNIKHLRRLPKWPTPSAIGKIF